MENANKILYRIRNILFLFFLIGCIKLIPNLKISGIFGFLLLILTVFYTFFMFYIYIKKEDNLNLNVSQNFLTIFLYLYVYLISTKYLQVTSNNMEINLLYFKVNYIICSLVIIGVSINNVLLLRLSKTKIKEKKK